MKTFVRIAGISVGMIVAAAVGAAEPRIPVPLSGAKLVVKKADVTDGKQGIIIGGAVGGAGGKFIPWNSLGDLSGVAPLPGTVTKDGRCAFNATYVERNIGAAATSPPYTNKLYVDGAVVAVNTNRQLNAGEAKTVTTQPYLKEGLHSLKLVLDDGNAVAEANEGNNAFSIRYKLECREHGAAIPGAPTISRRKPDLVPVLPTPMNGKVVVKNIGAGPAAASKLTLHCKKLGYPGPGGGCAEIPPAMAAPYTDPAFPDQVVVNVPNLAPGASFSHALSFWPALKWEKAKYQFTARADAAAVVAESNEANNLVVITVPLP